MKNEINRKFKLLEKITSIRTSLETFYVYIARTKHLEISLASRRDTNIVIVLIKFETNLTVYIKVSGNFLKAYISQKLPKHLNS